jgi:hypothetical protein
MVVLAGIRQPTKVSGATSLNSTGTGHALTMAITRSQTRNKQKDSENGNHHINASRKKPRKVKNIAARRSKAHLAYRRERLQTAILAQSWTHKQSHWINKLDIAIAAFKHSRPNENSTMPLPYNRARQNSGRTARRTFSGRSWKNAASKPLAYYLTRRLKVLHLPLVLPVKGRKDGPHDRR